MIHSKASVMSIAECLRWLKITLVSDKKVAWSDSMLALNIASLCLGEGTYEVWLKETRLLNLEVHLDAYHTMSTLSNAYKS